jgi:hypothetical protein
LRTTIVPVPSVLYTHQEAQKLSSIHLRMNTTLAKKNRDFTSLYLDTLDEACGQNVMSDQ